MSEPIEKFEELKPCPFCGNKAYFDTPNSVACPRCGLEDYSVTEWNSRPIEDKLRAQLTKWENGEIFSAHAMKIYEEQRAQLAEAQANRSFAEDELAECKSMLAAVTKERDSQIKLLTRLAGACWKADIDGELIDEISGDLLDELLNYLLTPENFQPPQVEK